jgi:hypothetical protein
VSYTSCYGSIPYCGSDMDIMEQIEEWAQEMYPDSVLLQEKFKEGAIHSLEVIMMAEAYATLKDNEDH